MNKPDHEGISRRALIGGAMGGAILLYGGNWRAGENARLHQGTISEINAAPLDTSTRNNMLENENNTYLDTVAVDISTEFIGGAVVAGTIFGPMLSELFPDEQPQPQKEQASAATVVFSHR